VRKVMCLILMVVMFMVATSCYALDVTGRIKTASDLLKKIDVRIDSLAQARLETIGRIKELRSIEAEQAKEEEKEPVEEEAPVE